MKKKLFVMALTLAMVFMLAACGGSGSDASGSQKSGSETSSTVDSIDLTYDEGNLKYVGFEKAVPGLTDAENAYVFIFDFTNTQDAAAQCQSVFKIQFFQNGAELISNASWNSKGEEQDELVNAYFSEALNGGTIHFGIIVVPKDSSPITIQATRNGAEDTVQMMEVDLGSDTSAAAGDSESADAGDIDAMLQGDWTLAEENSFHFENGALSLSQNGSEAGSGEYTVNTETSEIDCVLHADKDITFHLPFTVQDGQLHLYNNRNVELTHN